MDKKQEINPIEPMTNDLAISLEAVSYRYQKDTFLFDLTVEKGSIMALLGASGSGKSTLLSLIAGFIEPDSGEILVNQQSVLKQPPHKRPLAFLFQEHNLFDHLTVAQNIGLGINTALKLSSVETEQIQQAAQQVGLSDMLDRLPEQLSGGQKQRVALARCLVQPHDIWLLDEPFSALDPMLREEMLQLVKKLAKARNATVIMVTHHVSDAKHLANHFAFMQDGRLIKTAEIGELSESSDVAQVAEFVRVSG